MLLCQFRPVELVCSILFVQVDHMVPQEMFSIVLDICKIIMTYVCYMLLKKKYVKRGMTCHVAVVN